jgi:hypothetical protein
MYSEQKQGMKVDNGHGWQNEGTTMGHRLDQGRWNRGKWEREQGRMLKRGKELERVPERRKWVEKSEELNA